MENRRQLTERREYQRYPAMGRALAMISEPPANMPFHIIDISANGLAFRYLGERMQNKRIAELDLYYNDTLCVKGLPVASVADCWIGSDLTDIRRKCISFTGLTTEQKKQLELFIDQYTQSH